MKTALITGAGKRIGRAIALRLASEGYAIAVHYNGSKQAADDVAAAIREQGGKAEIFCADLSVTNDVRNLVKTVSEALSPPTCLVNNASTFSLRSPNSR